MTCTRERFLHDVRHHQMTIRQDEDLYRHITFARPGSSVHRFSLVTWPGYLAISGDCDNFMFTRIPDMFDFFRLAGPAYDKTDAINTGYWSEKAVSASKSSGLISFSEDRYKEAIVRDFHDHVEDMTPDEKKQVWAHIRDELLDSLPDSADEAITLAQDFKCPVTGSCPFTEFWDHNLMEASFGFTWACYAIQWGIKQYDLSKQGRSQDAHDAAVLAGSR